MSATSHGEEDLPDHILDDEPDSFPSGTLPPLTADDLIRDFVKSRLHNPRKSLSSAAARSSFLFMLLGDTSLATSAHDDAMLLRQLEARAVALVKYIANPITSTDDFETDAFVALLAQVAAQWSILLEAMEREGVTSVVISAMQRFSHHAGVAARCLTALRTFAVNDSMRKRVMYDNGIDATLHIMSIHQTDHRVQDRAAAVIANVAFGCPHRKRRIARQGGIKKIVDGMSAFPDDENIQLRGALTIRNLTYDAQVNQYIAGNQGAVEAVGSTMLRYRGSSANPELRFQCVLALDSLCRDDEHNRQRLVDMDRFMLSNPQSSSSISPGVSKQSCDTYTENVNEDGDIIVNEEEILAQDVSTNFRQGVSLRPDRPLDISPSLSSSEESGELDVNVTKGNATSGSTHQHSDEASKLSSTGTPAKQSGSPSLIRAIVHAVRRDPNHQLLLETGLSLLTMISINRPAVQLRLGELNGTQVAIAAIKRHPKSETVVAQACGLIRCLCMHKVNRGKITSGLPILMSAAGVHSQTATVSKEVSAALGNAIFENERNRSWLISKGGADVLVSIIDQSGQADVMVLEAAVCALRNFVHESADAASQALKEGIVRASVSALDRTKDAASVDERNVQEQAVKLLTDIARLVPRAKQEMIRLDAADWIENALAKLSVEKYPELHDAGDDLISALTCDEQGKNRTDRNYGCNPSEPSITGSDRIFFRGFFSGLFTAPWRKSKAKTEEKRRLAGRSMPIEREAGRSRRLSARFLKRSFFP